ncbi:ATP-binding protein [Halorubrum sp. ASP121]|uniref:sacsin N-terminal ATP-binding-like domain-containing protein n=1 Tax=Halorubrum sp. ASP121 TaxID=1855858 RepID=UPI0010F74C97|nr:hypothetical protein [Halorubrum sp. ASP121]TKX49550.1 ATP-binding protein [Halorubrum sp. ASP121]
MSEYVSVSDRLTNFCCEEHEELLDGLNNKTAWSKEADLGYGNQVVSAAHDDRTVLELVQNARDAIIEGDGNGSVSVIVGPDSLMVANTGSPFRLDDEEVFRAVTSLGRSAKAQDRGSIGEKGVGLKSVLQLSEQFSIYSQVDSEQFSAHFSRARAARMLLTAYGRLLGENSFRSRIGPSTNDTLVNACQSLASDIGASALPEYLTEDTIRRQLLNEEQEPPSPSALLSDLPRLSLFRYPFPDASQKDASPLRSGLVGTKEAAHTMDSPLSEDLRSWIDVHGGSYTTAVELDYVDTEWRALLDRVDGMLTDADDKVVSTFRDHRSSTDSDSAAFSQQRQETLWEECTNISPETLILLGHIEQLNLVRVSRNADGILQMENHRQITVDQGNSNPLSNEPTVSRRKVTYTVDDSQNDDSDSHIRTFWQYTGTYDDITENQEAGSNPDDVHLLFEKPTTKDGWRPKSKPLYLYYPIEEVETPFPFAIHAPFRVGFDRQSLTADEQNRRILDKLPRLVATAAADLATGESATDSAEMDTFNQWMPWLVTPLDAAEKSDTSEIVATAVEDTLGQLREEPIVPSDAGEPQRPTAVLCDPERLHAFEPLRRDAPAAPVPGRSVIESGKRWRTAVFGSESESGLAFRQCAARIGLTDVLDRLFDDDEGRRGCIDILSEYWGVSSHTEGTIDWAVPVDEVRHATEYFESICSVLQSASDGEELDIKSGTDAKRSATQLGDTRVPLLPAEAHRDHDDDDSPAITHLVRARSRHDGGEGGGTKRSERIVFRRTGGNTARSIISDLPTPPDDLPVFVVPFRSDWTGPLESFNREWGTRNLDSPAEFYRRVAAEAGGYSGDATSDPDVIGYIVDLYRTVTQSQIADWLNPQPHRHHQFGELQETLKGGKTGSLPPNYDDYLEQRYVQRVQLPVSRSDSLANEVTSTEPSDQERIETRPAEELSFGTEWAAEFNTAADTLEAAEPEVDRFSGQNSTEDTRADSFRRWAAAVRLASDATPSGTREIAPPDDDYWTEVFGDNVGSDELDRIRRLDTLIHLGVQVGPRIEWRWTLPTRGERDSEAGTLTVSDAQNLASGALPEGSDFSPPKDLVEAYRDTVWQSDNNPAFSASHSTGCGNHWLDPDVDTLVGDYPGAALLPMWWYLPDLPESESASGRDYRDAILLMWPELSDGVAEVAWLCSRWHSFSTASDDSRIPSLGLVQLAREQLWPAEGMFEEEPGDDRLTIQDGDQLSARKLLLHDDDYLRGAIQYLPRVDVGELEERLTDATDWDEGKSDVVDVPDALRSLGIQQLDTLTPPMAARRLKWFLSQFDEKVSIGAPGQTFTVKASWATQALSVPTDALLRRLVADDALSRELDDREPKRRWIRRDLHHLGTSLPVTEGSTPKALRIGRDHHPDENSETVVFTQPLSKYSRERLVNDGRRFVERPADETELAYMLGDESDAVDFGIVTETKPPSPRPIHGANVESGSNRLDDLRSKLRDRQEYLLAGYLENATAPNLQSVHDDLSAVFENPIGIVERSENDDVRRNSAEWKPGEGSASPHIALFRDSVDRYQTDDEAIPPYLAADGLVQVIEQFDLRDTFENVLFKNESALEDEYNDALKNIRREVTELRTRRLEEVFQTLNGLVSTYWSDVSLPTPDEFDVEPRETLTAARSATEREEFADGNPLLQAWSEKLTTECGLERDIAAMCLVAAATNTHETRLRIAYQLARDEVLNIDDLVDVGHQWVELDEWPQSRSSQSVESYVTAVHRLRRFWDTLADHEDEGEEGIERAVRETATSSRIPGPRRRVAAIVRGDSDLNPSLRNLRLGDIPYVTLEPPATEQFVDTVTEWVEAERVTLQESDIVYNEPDIDDFLSALVDAVSDYKAAEERVASVLATYEQRDGEPTTGTSANRSGLTTDWITSNDDGMEQITTEFEAAAAVTEGGSPDIGESSGDGYSHVNAEIDARGREGELICLDRAWRRFRDAPQTVRKQIFDVVREWRADENWRLNGIEDVASSLPDSVAGGAQSSEDLVALLGASELEATPETKAAFHALFDTSAERGPGFDLIDPFAMMPVDTELASWQSPWMRRVEVKAVDSGRIHNGRIKLTGNELRMALRSGPTGGGPDITDGDAEHSYLVRLVGFPTDWRENEDEHNQLQIFDIENVADFVGIESDSATVLEKLRGGSFYITFQT